MKTTLKSIVANFSERVKKSSLLQARFLLLITSLSLLVSSCSKDDAPQEGPDNTLNCKTKPGQITFGRDASDIKYDAQNKPVKITTTQYNPAAPQQPPVITDYVISYNTGGKVVKVTKSVNSQLELYYQMEYNSNGLLIKQSTFSAQGTLTTFTTAQYDNGILTKITTHTEGSSEDATTVYNYANGSLIKKSVANLYDNLSKEFYNADYTYTYFPDKENKITSYFEGPLGLVFISNVSNEPSLQYLPGKAAYQLFYAMETSSEKKMLKNVEIIAHRYNAHDTTNIDYTYEYDSDGFPTFQKGTYNNITRRYVADPFAGLVLIVTPHNSYFEKTMDFTCN